MANIEIDEFTFDGSSDSPVTTSLITLSPDKGYLWTVELIAPLVWPSKQFLIVERVLRRGTNEYRLNPVIKIYPGQHRDAFSFPVPDGLFNNDPRCGLVLSPRYYGPPGQRVGMSVLRVGYEDSKEYDITTAL